MLRVFALVYSEAAVLHAGNEDSAHFNGKDRKTSFKKEIYEKLFFDLTVICSFIAI